MEQIRTTLSTSGARAAAGRTFGKAQGARISDFRRAVLPQITQKAGGSLTQARLLLTEQGQTFNVLCETIGQMGQSLAELDKAESQPQDQRLYLNAHLNAQAEAIQGLTLLVLKGQQVQAELIEAVAAQTGPAAAPALPRWVPYALGAMTVWCLGTTAFLAIV
jgi:hypothetical protein